MTKRILALLLVLCLLVSTAAGCGGKEAAEGEAEKPVQAADGPEQTERDSAETESHPMETALVPGVVFQTSCFDLGAEQLKRVDHCCISGDHVFFCGQYVTGTTLAVNEATGEPVLHLETGEPIEMDVVETALFRMDLNTKETVRLDYTPAEPPEGMLGSANLSSMAASFDGGFWILEQLTTYTYNLPEDFDPQQETAADYYAAGDNLIYLKQYDADGQLLKALELSGLQGLGSPEMRFDADGNIYLNTFDVIYLLNPDGGLLAQLQNDSWNQLVQTDPAEVGLLDLENSRINRIDPALQGFGAVTPIPREAASLYPGAAGYDSFYEDYAGTVYGCRTDTDEAEVLFSWKDCNVERKNLSEIHILDDGRVAAIQQLLTTDSIEYQLVVMEPADADALSQITELTLACLGSYSISSAVTAFNQSQSDVKIVIRDYSEYSTDEDQLGGLTRLTTELLSGNIPDLLLTFQLPTEQFVGAGILMDLWPLIDSDMELNRDDLMTHLFEAMSIDGKLYEVTDSFSIYTAAADAGVIGDRTGWTVDEALEAMAAMPDASEAFGLSSQKSLLLVFLLRMNFEHFIDWENQTCSFDSPEFLELLNFANSFPDQFEGDETETTYERFQAGTQLLLTTTLSDFHQMQAVSAQVGGNPCFVGYPSSMGSGSVFSVSNGVAITTACQDVDAAWSFLRTLLTEEYQQSNVKNGFPSNRHAFEAMVEKEMAPENYTQKEIIDVDGSTFESQVMTQAEYDRWERLYESCIGILVTNDALSIIVQQEAQPFFDGQKTAEEAAALIQDRIGLYVMEQK